MKNTTLCYIEKDNKYLMLHRTKKKNDPNESKYIGIGGHLEEKESPLDCVIREAMEETGLCLNNPDYCGIVTFVSDKYETEQMHLFTCTDFSGTLTECNEGELLWVEKSKLKSLPMWQGDIIFLNLLQENAPFFSLKLCYEGDSLVSAHLNGKRL
ncbi:MAG: 8-oxo-dGTP diphosphatase [Clostridia bacterium]|nr:8-oxo-dGTP diphosphatase [Clostridia bacterium]